MKPLGTALPLAVALLASTHAHGGEGVVLAVRPEGVVVDASALPTIQPGARVGFVRPDAQRTPTGQGFVLDLQAGQALVGIVPGTGVQVSDLVVLCPPRGPGTSDQARTLVDGIRAQSSSPQVQAAATQLQSVLDARDAAIQQGSCDVARFDQEAQNLLGQLQSQAAPAQAAPSTATGSPPAGVTAPGSLPVSGDPAGGYSPTGPTYPPAPGGTAYQAPDASSGAPPDYAQGGAGAGSPGQPGDVIDTATRGADLLAKLVAIAQTLGVTAGGAGAGGAQPGSAPAGGSALTGSGGYPPAGGGYVPPTGGVAPPGGAGSSPASGTSSGTGAGTTGGAKATGQLTQVPSSGIRPQIAVIPPKATVTGRVQTQTGQPLAAAQITVGNARGQTDAQGQFTVPGLPPGQHMVTVTAIGYQKQTRTVTLDAGETERIVVVMPRVTPITPYRAVPTRP